jgi:hypothetical protein
MICNLPHHVERLLIKKESLAQITEPGFFYFVILTRKHHPIKTDASKPTPEE